MPRASRQKSSTSISRGLGLQNRDLKHAGNVMKGMKPGNEVQRQTRGLKKIQATTTVAGSKRRAALGEITNALTETTSQAKKGLSKMLSKSRSSLSRRSSSSNTNKVLSGSSSRGKDTQHERQDVGLIDGVENEQEDSSLILSSLPSSNEVVLKKVQEEDITEGNLEESVDEENRPAKSDRRPVPEGVIDFDKMNANDHFQVSEYAMETFQYYKDREAKFRVPDYLSKMQPDITEVMRSILVDWMVEVQESFELNHETLYTGVKMIDLYLSTVQVKKEELQLIGATACLIACKVDERIPPMLDDFVYVCDDAYSKDDIMRKEREMISTVGYDVGYPLSYRFLRRYGRVCQVTMPVLTLGRYILEMALMEYRLNVEVSESLLAASALLLTFRLKDIEGWERTLEFYSGYSVEECRPTAKKLHKMLLRPRHEMRKTIRIKYEHQVFHQVAKIPIPEELEL